jgi:TonB family protein
MPDWTLKIAALVMLGCCCYVHASEPCAELVLKKRIMEQASQDSTGYVVFRGQVSSLPPERDARTPVLSLPAVYFDYAVDEVLWGHVEGAAVHAPYVSEPPCGRPALVLHAKIVTFCFTASTYCLNPVPASEENLTNIRKWVEQAKLRQQIIPVSAEEARTHLVHESPPVYSSLLEKVRINGDVVVRIVIDAQGRVERAQAVSGHPLLVSSAIDTVRQWRYTPFRLGDRPVRAETTVTVHFKL